MAFTYRLATSLALMFANGQAKAVAQLVSILLEGER